MFRKYSLFFDEFRTRRHLNTWTEKNQTSRPKKKFKRQKKLKKKQFPPKNHFNFWNEGRLNMIIVIGTPELVCITRDNMLKRKKVMKIVQSTRLSSTDKRKNKKKMNEKISLEFRFTQFQSFEHCLKSYFIASITSWELRQCMRPETRKMDLVLYGDYHSNIICAFSEQM